MKTNDLPAFAKLFADVMAYYKADVSNFTQTLFWNELQEFDFEQVAKAFGTHAKDAEHGRFAPKLADMVRILAGTQTDRSLLAWGKVLESLTAIGAYTDVIFDDPAIHAAVQDAGGWPKICRTETKELGFVQLAFCKAHRAYTGRGSFDYPRMLSGERNADSFYAAKGLPPPKPAIVGDPTRCAHVYQNGGAAGKTAISFHALGALAVLAMPVPAIAQDAQFKRIGRAQ